MDESTGRCARRSNLRRSLGVISLVVGSLAFNALGQIYVIEPDSYTNDTVLDHISPAVYLTSAGADNLPIPPVPFEVTASEDNLHLAPTGTNVFGHAGVPFWNTDRRLRMAFTQPVSFVSIDFAGGQFFTNETGRLDVYNADGQLIASRLTSPQPAGRVETMTINRETSDITLAIAYVPPGAGVFGRLDRLRFGRVGPSTLVISGLSAAVNGNVVLSFNGAPDFQYRIWASMDLLDWQIIGTATQLQPGVYSYQDPGARINKCRFYRVDSP